MPHMSCICAIVMVSTSYFCYFYFHNNIYVLIIMCVYIKDICSIVIVSTSYFWLFSMYCLYTAYILFFILCIRQCSAYILFYILCIFLPIYSCIYYVFFNVNGYILFCSVHVGMDVELRHTHLTYKMIGGIIDMFVLVGPTPKVYYICTPIRYNLDCIAYLF